MKRFLRISYGSLCEVEFFTEFASRRKKYIKGSDLTLFDEKKKDLANLLRSFGYK